MIHTTPDDTFDIIMKIHVRAPFRLIRQAAPYFRLKVSSLFLIFRLQTLIRYSLNNERTVPS